MKYAIIAALATVALAAPEWKPVETTTTPEWKPIEPTTTKEEWKPVEPTTTKAWEPVKVTTPAVWEPVKPETTKCSSVSSTVTKECGDKKDNEWAECKYVTKYYTSYPEKCDYVKPTTTWAEYVKPETTKCSTTSVYVTKVCGDKKGDEWADCKEVTKTATVYPTVCPTPVKVTDTWVPVKASETWAPVKETTKPVVAATTSAWSPVASFKGAADKSTFGMGALAIAAVAALL